jgi:ADP-ribose diphosphatase
MSKSDPKPAPWARLATETLEDCRVFSLERRRMARKDPPAEADFFVLKTPDWVNIVALTDDDELVLVEQFRHGRERITLEIPGGMVDPGESPLAAAERELLEETGYAAREWRQIGVIEPNPAILDNRCHTFLALGAKRVREARFDSHEQCRLVIAPYADVDRLVAKGKIAHALVVVALHFEALRRAGVEWSGSKEEPAPGQ